jgi:hypothetical protein
MSGRKPKPRAERASVNIRIRMTDRERRIVERDAGVAGLTISAYVRRVVTRGPVRLPPAARIMAMLAFELRTIAATLTAIEDATGEPSFGDWARYLGDEMLPRAEGRIDLARLAASAIPELENVGIALDRLKPLVGTTSAVLVDQVGVVMHQLRAALEPLRQALKSPPPDAMANPTCTDAL